MYKKKKEKIVITGGSGYIGSVLAKNLSKRYAIYLIDVKKPLFKSYDKFIKLNLNNKQNTFNSIYKINPDIIIHLAAQSTVDMLKSKKKSYFINNIIVTKNLVDVAKKLKISKFIFSSTAAVYKASSKPLKEKSELKPTNLYGKTKLINENYIISRFKNSKTKYCILRFFNVCSANIKNKIGELHNPETHLVPILIHKALENKKIKIYGKNYNTKDGTCIRDYIHILDIVSGITKSISYLKNKKNNIFNLGSERGFSVLEILNNCKKIIDSKSNIIFIKRRFGDIDKLICNISKAKKILKWKPTNSNLNKIISNEISWNNYIKKNKIIRKFIY